MDLEIIILSEVSQTEKDKYHDITYIWNLKQGTKEHRHETERFTDAKNRPVEGDRGRGEREGWTGSLGLADANYYIEWRNSKVPLYSTGNYIQYPVTNHNGKG